MKSMTHPVILLALAALVLTWPPSRDVIGSFALTLGEGMSYIR